MKLCFGTKQGLAAANALIASCGLRVLVFAGERRLRSLLPRHIVLILRELFLPSGFVFEYFFFHSPLRAAYVYLFMVVALDSAHQVDGSTCTTNTDAHIYEACRTCHQT